MGASTVIMLNGLDLPTRVRRKVQVLHNRQRLNDLSLQVAAHEFVAPGRAPVSFFNASTRLGNLSLNAAFSLLTSWSLRLSGTPVSYFTCSAGMSRCVLGTNPDDVLKTPPCDLCTAQSSRMYRHGNVYEFTYAPDPGLATAIHNLAVDQLSELEYPIEIGGRREDLPLGALVLPSLRWALRKHHLDDDEPTRFLFSEYLLSAYRVAQAFNTHLDQTCPETLVLFNGIMYPEAAARWVARQRGLRVITHEVGFQPFSAFFSDGEATAYPVEIPPDFELDDEQNELLSNYLQERFQGNFTMAGIQFWPEMRGLDEAFLERAARFRQIVPVFTNVVFDTSQVHANQVFPHMFAWLDLALDLFKQHPDTLFVIRAHPDEMRPGSDKQSRESVQAWVERNGVAELPNVIFISPEEYISSYELIQRAKFVMVYNSSIGLEASLMGAPVLCGGKARYTQYPIVFFPDTPAAYREQAEEFLRAETVTAPEHFRQNARRFLYYQFFKVSLSFADYLQDGPLPGYVELKPIQWPNLLPENNRTMGILVEGLTNPKNAHHLFY